MGDLHCSSSIAPRGNVLTSHPALSLQTTQSLASCSGSAAQRVLSRTVDLGEIVEHLIFDHLFGYGLFRPPRVTAPCRVVECISPGLRNAVCPIAFHFSLQRQHRTQHFADWRNVVI